MQILFILVPLTLCLVALGAWGFLWAVNSGQFDDLESPGWEILRETDTAKTNVGDTAP